MTKVNTEQLNFFDLLTASGDENPTDTELMFRLLNKTEELRLVVADYARLKPEERKYEEIVRRYRGVTSFNFRQNKFDAMEARNIVRFLKTAPSTIDNLKAEISDLNRLLGFEHE